MILIGKIKRYFVSIVISIFICVLVSINVSASKIEIGPGLSIATKNDYIDSGHGIYLNLTYLLTDWIKVRTVFIRYGFNTKDYEYRAGGDYSLSSFEGSILFNGKITDIQPYLGGGIGYYYIDVELDSYSLSEFERDHYAIFGERVDDVFGWHYQIGANVNLISDLIISIGVKHIFVETEVQATLKKYGNSEIVPFKEKINLGTLLVEFAVLVRL